MQGYDFLVISFDFSDGKDISSACISRVDYKGDIEVLRFEIGQAVEDLYSLILNGDVRDSVVNDHGKFVLDFSKAHNMTIIEAMQHPTVQAHRAWYERNHSQGNQTL